MRTIPSARLEGKRAIKRGHDSSLITPTATGNALGLGRAQIRRYFVSRLPGQVIRNREQINAKCPFHEDNTPSLSINLDEGVWNCHGCGESGGLLDFELKLNSGSKKFAWAAIEAAMGIENQSASVAGAADPEAIYPYVDAYGKSLHDVMRYSGKQFRQRRPGGKGEWIWNLDGVPRVLYNLPALRRADVAFLSEGERDANTLTAKLGLDKPRSNGSIWAATTNSGGALNWNPKDGKNFKNKLVIVFEDNDDAGRKRSNLVLPSVYRVTKKLKLIRLPGLKPGGDVSDWLLEHSTRELIEIIKKTKRWHPPAQGEKTTIEKRQTLRHDPAATTREDDGPRPDLICLADVEARDVNWLWAPYLPLRMLTMMSGDPMTGKTFLALEVAAKLTRGRTPNGFVCPPCNVIYMTVENAPEEVLRPRFDALQGNAKRFHILRGTICKENGEDRRGAISLSDVARIEEAIVKTGARLVVVDPIQSYLGAKVDMHRSNETRPVLDGLAKLAEKHNCAILLLRHITKQSGGRAIHRGLGSIDLTGAVRSELLAGSLPDNPKSRALVHIKSNIGPLGPSIGYEIDDKGNFRWLKGPCAITAAQLLEPPTHTKQHSQLSNAILWLTEELAEGPKPATDLQEAAEGAGISWITVRRAQRELGIKPQKSGMHDGWVWALPKDGGDGD